MQKGDNMKVKKIEWRLFRFDDNASHPQWRGILGNLYSFMIVKAGRGSYDLYSIFHDEPYGNSDHPMVRIDSFARLSDAKKHCRDNLPGYVFGLFKGD